MVVLNHFHKSLFITLYITSASAGVIPLFNPNDVAKSNTLFLHTNTLLVNDPFTLKNLFGGLKGDFHPKNGMNYAFGITRNDIGFNIKNFGYIGYAYREEIYMKAYKSTLELLYLTTNKKDLQTGNVYDFDLALEAYKMHSFVYANTYTPYKNKKSIIEFGYSAEALLAYDMQSGFVDGMVVANSQKDYTYEGVSHYHYTHNYLYDLNVNSPHGYGYTTHLSLDAHYKNIHITFLANDIYGKIYWKDLPYSDVYLSSQNKSYDENGYAQYAPLLSGKEGYMKFTQTLVAKYKLETTWKYGKNIYLAGSDYLYNTTLPYIDYTRIVNDNFSFGIGYGVRFKTLKLSTTYKNFQFQTRFDDIYSPFALGCDISYFIKF
jgi:hypothetical protein